MTDIFRSSRLIYRGVDSPGDEAITEKLAFDRIGYMNSQLSNIRLANKSVAKQYLEDIANTCFFAAVICLPASTPDLDPKPTPIGLINLRGIDGGNQHHRRTNIGITLFPEFQGKGYGSEAIRWALRYAFHHANLHRVGIGSVEFNQGALRLYEKLGFKHEGRSREAIWHDGRFWDLVEMGMLESEWRDIQRAEEESSKAKGKEST